MQLSINGPLLSMLEDFAARAFVLRLRGAPSTLGVFLIEAYMCLAWAIWHRKPTAKDLLNTLFWDFSFNDSC